VIAVDVFAVCSWVGLWHGVAGTECARQATDDKATAATFCSTGWPARGCLKCSQCYHRCKGNFIA